MRRLFAAAAGCAIIVCMLFSFSGQDKPYKDIEGESFKVIAQLNSSEQLNKAAETAYQPVKTEQAAGRLMLTYEFYNYEQAEKAYLILKKAAEAVYIEGGMPLSAEQGEALLNRHDFTQSSNMYFCRERIQRILRKTASGYYLTTGYPYIISGC